MPSEYAVVCALPYSLSSEAEFNVSLYLSPTIESPDATKLREWDLFPDWGETASAMRVELSDDRGVIECEPQLGPIDPDLWRALFPGSLRVMPNSVPNWSEREWSSFSARRVHDIALALHMATILSDPANPPLPTDHPLAREIYGLAVRLGCYPEHGRLREGLGRYDESKATAQLDATLKRARSLQDLETLVAGVDDWTLKMALELHRCRRYYERPEAQWPHRADPIDGAKPPPLPENEPEFHTRCALFGDHAELLRHLGLVIDVIADPGRMRGAQWLSAALHTDNGAIVSRATRVRCQSSGELFTTAPRTADWSEGALRLGDSERFAVLTLDTDGSALKADRYIWTLPRLMAVQENGDPVDAASPALRSPGFTVSGTSQAGRAQGDVSRQAGIAGDLKSGRVPVLDTEDVVRGMRVDVWDDESGKWHSLHERRTWATVHGYPDVIEDDRPGFIQGTAAHENFRSTEAPVQVHEALFGWEGWSLSAPRPGKRIWEKDGKEELLEEDEGTAPDAVHPYHVKSRVRAGSLPRLRYGRSYAFRAWAVDLAGNSRPHELNPPTATPSLSDLEGGEGAALPSDPIASKLMAAASATAADRAARDAEANAPLAADLGPEVLAHARIKRSVSSGASLLAQGASRSARVSAAVSEAFASGDLSRWSPAAQLKPGDLGAVVGSHMGSLLPGAASGSGAVKKALETVTKPCPFLRWEPVPSPAVVPRWRFTEGESLRVLVVRSGVTQDPGTLAITLEEPEDFVATATTIVPECGYHSTSERHLAPPKITQLQAELHGMLDTGMGQVSAAKRRQMLGWALRADGTFADRERADIDNPPAKIEQPGMSIVYVGEPTTNLKALPPLSGEPNPPAGTPVIGPGDPPAPGQTILHDVDELTLPYLPDPMARGVALHFPEAGRSWGLPFPYGGEGFTVSYGGDWPELEPFRFVLEGGPSLTANVDGRVIRMMLPPGDVQLLRASSSLPKDKLDLMGAWHFLPEPVRSQAEVTEAAADGMLWGLSPFEQVTLIHAVNRPVEAPRPVHIKPQRSIGSTNAILTGAVDLHGPSTGTLSFEAQWEEPLDDPTLPKCIIKKLAAKAFQTIIQPAEDLALLGGSDQQWNLPDIGLIYLHRAVHEFSDTRHRKVDYTLRAFTRFREFFHPDLLKDRAGKPSDNMHSVVGPMLHLSIPSSAPPAPPIVHSVLPMFRWSDETEPEQPMARRRTRRAGVRIYLERPWFTSGDGELLGVLIADTGDDSHYPQAPDQSGYPFVSKWGADPIWTAREVERRAFPMLRLDDFLRLAALDDRIEAARPVVAPRRLPLPESAGAQLVMVLGYKPEFNEERGLWFADVAIDPGSQFWPFLRLAVCRYQPESIDKCHLSHPVQCDFVQLPPERTAAVSRTDDRHVRVLVSGPIGWRMMLARASETLGLGDPREHDRRLVARLQRRDPKIGSDLGWETVAVEKLRLRGLSADGFNATWVAELDAGEVVPLAKPGTFKSDRRVSIEEWELIEADDLVVTIAGHDRPLPHTEPRLVYADNIGL
jgi:hypothetical protein